MKCLTYAFHLPTRICVKNERGKPITIEMHQVASELLHIWIIYMFIATCVIITTLNSQPFKYHESANVHCNSKIELQTQL
jgi:hypothetical protein